MGGEDYLRGSSLGQSYTGGGGWNTTDQVKKVPALAGRCCQVLTDCVQGFARGKSHSQPSTGSRKVRTILHLQSTEPALQVTQGGGPRWLHKPPTHSNLDWDYQVWC